MQLHLDGRPCLVVGGGAVATRRVRSLLQAGAIVTVVAPDVSDDLRDMALVGLVELVGREFRDGDVSGVDLTDQVDGDATGERWTLVVVATDSTQVNGHIGDIARSSGVLVNRADDAPAGDLAFPATIRRGPVTVAVSSQGRSPVLSRFVAERLDDGLDHLIGLDARGLELLAEVLAEVRRELRRDDDPAEAERRGVTVDPVDWRSALDGSILELINEGRRAEAKERLLACLSS